MASIPLPELDLRPVQQTDPIGEYGKVLALKSQANQQQLQQGQAQLQQAQLAQEQIHLKDMQSLQAAAPQHTIKDANGNITGYDWQGLINDAAQKGVSPQTLQGLQKNNLDIQTQLIGLSEKQRADREGAISEIYPQIEGLRGIADPSVRQQQYQQILPKVAGLASRLGLDPSKLPAQVPDDNGLNTFEATLGMHQQQLADAGKLADAAKAGQQAREAAANATQKELQNQQIAGGALPPDMAKAKYQGILSQIEANDPNNPVTPQQVNFAKGYEASERKSTSTSDTLGVTSSSASGPTGLAAAMAARGRGASPISAPAPGATPPASGTPASPQSGQNLKQSIVDAIGNYQYDPAMFSRMMLKHPEIAAMVAQKYPDFDQANYGAKASLLKKFATSPEIAAINTTAGHVGELYDAIDGLNNGNMAPLNKIANAYNINIAGQTPAAAFRLIVNRVGPEIAKAYIPGGGGEAERFANQQDFDPSLAPQILKNNAAETVKLLQSKIGALGFQYQQAVGRNDFQQRFITPAAQQAFRPSQLHREVQSAQELHGRLGSEPNQCHQYGCGTLRRLRPGG